MLNFISKNIVFEKISEKNQKKYFSKHLRKLFFRVFTNLRKNIFYFPKKKIWKFLRKKSSKTCIFCRFFFPRHTQKRRHHSHTKQVIKLLGVSRVPDISRNSQGARPLVIIIILYIIIIYYYSYYIEENQILKALLANEIPA